MKEKSKMDRRSFLASSFAISFLPTLPSEFRISLLETNEFSFRAPFLLVNKPNKNNHIYPRTVVEKAIAKNQGKIFGHLGMPQTSLVDFQSVSHTVEKFSFEKYKGDVWLTGKFHVIDSPCGKILKNMLENNVSIAFRTCGVGEKYQVFLPGEFEPETLIIDSYNLCSVNAIEPECAA